MREPVGCFSAFDDVRGFLDSRFSVLDETGLFYEWMFSGRYNTGAVIKSLFTDCRKADKQNVSFRTGFGEDDEKMVFVSAWNEKRLVFSGRFPHHQLENAVERFRFSLISFSNSSACFLPKYLKTLS